MKKSLVALAVLAASGASFAQSNVTLYGIADIWLGSLKESQITANPDRLTKLDSGGVSTSRWGIKGSEDLGGGLNAIFTLESKVGLDTGASAGFSRESYVGLEGGFGTVKLGKMWTATDDVMGASNSGFDSALSATNGVWVANAVYSVNPGNSIKYSSPSMGGFSFAATYGLDETENVNNDMMDFSVSYAGGPVAANFAYQVQKDYTATDDLKIATVNGSYDFGVAKLLASYAQTKAGDADVKDYQIGADIPVSPSLTVSAGYAQSKRNDAAVATPEFTALVNDSTSGIFAGKKNTGYSVAASYSLSKRTSIYGGASYAKGETAGTDVSKRELYAVGVRHAF